MRQFYAASVFDDARLKGDRGGGGAERNAVALICGKITEVYIFGSDCNVLEISLEQCGVTAAVRAHESETRMFGIVFLEVDIIPVEVVPVHAVLGQKCLLTGGKIRAGDRVVAVAVHEIGGGIVYDSRHITVPAVEHAL